MSDRNTADYRCRECGASISWQSGVCSACLPPSGLERRETAFSDLPGGGVCRCLNPESPVVCEDCPELTATDGVVLAVADTCDGCGAFMHSLVDRDRGMCDSCWFDEDGPSAEEEA